MAKSSLIEIARRTGYSITTVSRALSGQGKQYRVSDHAIELITAEARKCNYVPSLIAQSLRTNRTRTIGLVVPAIENPFFANIASVIVQQAKQQGYTVVLVDAMESEADEREGVRSLLARNVDGIMISPSGSDPAYLEQINAAEIPVVLIDRFFPDTTLPYVSTDNYLGACEAVRMLTGSGHRKIACIQGVPHSTPVAERARGYLETMREAGLEEQIEIVGNSFSIHNGYVEARLLLSRPDPPTAIFAMSNTILLGTVKAAGESGRRIPDDVSVISFDDNTYLDFLSPAITRVVQPIDEIGSIAIKILLQSIRDGHRARTRITLPARLVVRGSVGRV
jgi:LacI family transcriptional regulator